MQPSTKKQLRATAICAAVLLICALMISTVLPWLSENGYVGSVLQHSYQEQRDVTPLFYTESERSWEILQQFNH